MTRCEDCGAELQIGDFPFCHGDPTKHARGRYGVIGDECDFVQENGAREPMRFRSKLAYHQWLEAAGLEQIVRHVPVPGTDRSPHTTDWSKGSIDPYTLEAARILTERAATPIGPDDSPDTVTPLPVTFTVREVGTLRIRS